MAGNVSENHEGLATFIDKSQTPLATLGGYL
jgi:hypothetical protein